MIRARSEACAFTRSPQRRSACARTIAVVADHDGSAAAAASIAARVSAAPSFATETSVSPVAGLTTSNVAPPPSPSSARVHASAMKPSSRRSDASATPMRAASAAHASDGGEGDEVDDDIARAAARADDARALSLSDVMRVPSGRPPREGCGSLRVETAAASGRRVNATRRTVEGSRSRRSISRRRGGRRRAARCAADDARRGEVSRASFVESRQVSGFTLDATQRFASRDDASSVDRAFPEAARARRASHTRARRTSRADRRTSPRRSIDEDGEDQRASPTRDARESPAVLRASRRRRPSTIAKNALSHSDA